MLCGVHTGRLVYQAEEASGVVEPGTRAAKKPCEKWPFNFKNLQLGLETKNKSLSIMETGS